MNKVHFVLDLDQTLISAENLESKKNVKGKFDNYNMSDQYIVYERPYLQPFLDYIFKNCIVTVWTAANKNYATSVIKNVLLKDKPERKIDFIFFRYHGKISEHFTTHTKDLEMFWDKFEMKGYTNKNTLILDDNEEVYETQNRNCIAAPEFNALETESKGDKFLKTLLDKVKSMVEVVGKGNDIRPVIEKINKEIK